MAEIGIPLKKLKKLTVQTLFPSAYSYGERYANGPLAVGILDTTDDGWTAMVILDI